MGGGIPPVYTPGYVGEVVPPCVYASQVPLVGVHLLLPAPSASACTTDVPSTGTVRVDGMTLLVSGLQGLGLP